MYKKMFLVAIGGKSVDGRDLPDEDIFAIAENYNPEIYTAGIVYDFNHFQNVVGTVKHLTAKMVAGKARLYAEVVVGDELLETAENWTQPYYFALAVQYGSGKPLPSPYLVNLATNPKAAFEGIDTISYSALKACMQPDVSGLEVCRTTDVCENDIPPIPFTRQRYYRNGAHAGNIYYGISGWGMNGPKDEATLKELIRSAISPS